MKKSFWIWIAAALIMLFPVSGAAQGRDFWVMYLRNHNDAGELSLVAAANDTGHVRVENPVTGWSTEVSLGNEGRVQINVPRSQAVLPVSAMVGNGGLHVTSTTDISLCALNYKAFSFDITTVYPSSSLRSHYIVQDYAPTVGTTEFGVVASEDNTQLEIDVPGYGLMVFTLMRGQTFFLEREWGQSLSGTEIFSGDKPVAVFMGNVCAQVPMGYGYCDHLYEQALPVDFWGRSFVVTPVTPRTGGQVVRVTAAEEGCQIYIDGEYSITLSARQTHNFSFASGEVHRIETSSQVMVCQYLTGDEYGGSPGDPASVIVPPVEQGVREVTFNAYSTASTTHHYTSIVVRTDQVDGMTLDGVGIAESFLPVGTEYSYAVLPVEASVHTLQCSGGRFVASFLGLGDYESYAYTVGMALRDLRTELYVDQERVSHNGDTVRQCGIEPVTFRVETYEGDTTVQWYVDGVLQSESSPLIQRTFPAGIHYVTALLHGTCETNWCDTLHVVITVNQPVVSQESVTVQNAYTWREHTFSASKDTTITIIDSDGCDSIFSLHLRIFSSELPDNVDDMADCMYTPDSISWGIRSVETAEWEWSDVPYIRVGDMDGDGSPEIVGVTTSSSQPNVVVTRSDGTQLSSFDVDGFPSQVSYAIGRVQWQPGVYKSIIVIYSSVMGTSQNRGYLKAYDYQGNILWSTEVPNHANTYARTVSFADFNLDGWSEIYMGTIVFDAATGIILCRADNGTTPMRNSFAADLWGDGKLELASANKVYNVNLQSRTTPSRNSMTVSRQITDATVNSVFGSTINYISYGHNGSSPRHTNAENHTFLVDINNDGRLDVVVLGCYSNSSSRDLKQCVYAWDVQTQSVIAYRKIDQYVSSLIIPQNAVFGDVDGDDYPEIIFRNYAASDGYQLIMLRYSSSITGHFQLVWSSPVDHYASPAIFDFNQDGKSELVCRNGADLYILNASFRHHQTNAYVGQPYALASYHTSWTSPIVIADIDEDGAAEIVTWGDRLIVLKSSCVPWAPARKVWNQGLYNVTNVNDDLTITQYPLKNTTPFVDRQGTVRHPYNNFNQQATTIDPFGVPFRKAADIALDTAYITYSDDSVTIGYTYHNQGDCSIGKPHYVTAFLNQYRDSVLFIDTVFCSLAVDSSLQRQVTVPRAEVSTLRGVQQVVVAVNCAGGGIAQKGCLDPECDLTNNLISLAILPDSLPQDSITIAVDSMRCLFVTRDTIVACDSLLWRDTIFRESGIYTLVSHTLSGCDSIDTLFLTVHHSTSFIHTDNVCDSLRWHDSTYTASTDVAIYHTLNAEGCDSTVTLNLVVRQSSTSSLSHNACESYSWHEFVGTSDTTFQYHTTNAAGCDSLAILTLSVNYSTTSDTSVTACDSYTWNGITATSDTTLQYHTTNVAGCDSNVTLNLIVNHVTSSVQSHIACNSYTWNGITATSDTTLQYHTTNVSGCDSTATLHLTVNHATSSIRSHTACDSYTWNGITATSDTTFQYHTTNVSGCDSTVTLYLTVNHATSSMQSHTACDSYTWNGITATADTTLQYHTTNVAGCDSNVTLNLIVNHVTSSVQSHIACNSYAWNGITATSDTTLQYHTTNAAGCDSTATLYLTVNHATSSTQSYTACDSYTWNGFTATADTTLQYHTTNTTGCDSLAILTLSVHYSTTSDTSVMACDSYSWHGTTAASDTTIQYHTANAVGCDSTATLYLTINHSSHGDTMATACNSFTWYGQTYTASTTTPVRYLTNVSGCDSTVTLHLTVHYSTVSSQNYTACGSHTWHGITTTADTTLQYHTTNAAGCDSTATLNLTFHHSSTSQVNHTACDSYTWNGITATVDTTLQYHTINVSGCDSTVTLHLTVNHATSSIQSHTACDSYTWNGITATSDTTLQYHTTNVAGCDSTATLYLAVRHPSTLQVNHTACDSYTWNGITAISDTTLQYHTTNVSGCDSTVTLYLTINHATSSIQSHTACDSYTWNGFTATVDTTLQYHTTNTAGCDSLAILTLSVQYSTTSDTSVMACDSYSWHGTTAVTDTTIQYHTANAVGCDSTATLYLTINHSSHVDTMATACDSFTWYGQTYTTSTSEPIRYLANVAGCDSTVTLHLMVHYSTVSSQDYTACGSHTWHGITATADTTLQYHTTNVSGCDSTATLNLTFHYSSTSQVNHTACDSYTWNGITATADTMLQYHTTNVSGCDSTVTLYLTVNHATSSMQSHNACDSYTWNGITATADTTLQYHTTNTTGCDSLAILTLSVHYSTTSDTSVTACNSYSWHGIMSTADTTLLYDTTNAEGCDSTATMHLFIHYPTVGDTMLTACDSYTWYGQIYTMSTESPTQHLTNVAGCDSTVTLHLTVNHSSSSVYTDNVCDSLRWHDSTYTASTDTAVYHTLNVEGCDSTVTLYLTVNHSFSGVDIVDVCDSLVWHDSTYTVSTSQAIYQTTNAVGCDSIVTLHLTIHHGDTSIVMDTVVESDLPHYYHSYTFSSDTALTMTFTNEAGCDSVVNYTLHVVPNSATRFDTTVCENQLPFVWHQHTFTAEGFVADTLIGSHGEDSVLLLFLAVNPSFSDTVMASICDGGTYHFEDSAYTTGGFWTRRAFTRHGCDSLRTLALTVMPNTMSDIMDTACDSYVWHDIMCTSDTILQYDTINSEGCDSAATLHLTIHHHSSGTLETTACDSLQWNGSFVVSDTTLIFDTLNSVGCDSTITIKLKMMRASYEETTDTFCWSQFYTWRTQAVGDTSRCSRFLEKEYFLTDTLLSSYGCDSILAIRLVRLPQLSVVLMVDTICQDHGYNLFVDSNTVNYPLWNSSPVDSALAPQAGQTTVFVSPTVTTQYIVTVSYNDTGFCPTTQSITLKPLEKPQAMLKVIPQVLSLDHLDFTAYDLSDDYPVRNWYIDWEKQSETFRQLHHITTPDKDSVTVAIEVYDGLCHDTAVAVLPIVKVALYASNIFNPTDPNNSEFIITGVGVTEGELYIYNRQGLLIHQANAQSSSGIFEMKWDGRLPNGALAPQDAYVYKLNYQTIENRKKTMVGTVTLVK